MPRHAGAFIFVKKMRFFLVFCAAILQACTSSTAGDTKTKLLAAENKNSDKVLIELFTSQGCSSCPSADKLISSLAQTDTNLIVLSFHVDYWDRLGWKDVFSHHDYTLRQQQYAQMFRSQSVYTPQAVVQGQFEMVGSSKPGITSALAKVKKQHNNTILTANAVVNGDAVAINFSFNATPVNRQLIAALVQIHANTSIQRGENKGIELEGYNVVREFKMIPLSATSGNLKMMLPSDIKADNTSVVLFMQDAASKKIEAVTQVKL